MYKVQLRRRVLKEIAKLPNQYARLVSQHLDELENNPRPPSAKKLKNDPGYSLRVGVYRILYDVDDDAQVVTVYRVKHRREVYR